ncbi:MAG: prolyl oligopeptidase family serine peptidase [Nocardioidaceae bacterium]
MPEILPYGAWPSSITADLLLSSAGVDLAMPRVDGPDTYWLQARASEGGRGEVVRRTPDGTQVSITPAPWNVRSRVHEYGGGAYAVRDGILIFANLDDLRLYRVDVNDPATAPVPLMPEGVHRYAEPVIDLRRRRVIAIREDHTDPAAPVNTLVSLDLDGENADGGNVIVEGTDFVAAADLSPDGDRLAWVSWDLPRMPWEASTVHRADLDEDGGLSSVVDVTDGTTWVQQPRWAPDGRLFFIEETGGWANLAVLDPEVSDATPRRFVAEGLEFGSPNWFVGARDYDFLPDGRIVAAAWDTGIARLVVVDPREGSSAPLDGDIVAIDGLSTTSDGRILSLTSTRETSKAVVLLTVPDGVGGAAQPGVETLVTSSDLTVDPAMTSLAESVTWTNSRGETVHGFYYPPAQADVLAPDSERPPLLVESHGGPTSLHTASFKLGFHYWTSRGFAILDVNYGGSSGYGRAYRERLEGQWGVVDIDDCVTGALAMAEQGRADPKRLAIRGGSAGGYTTLRALTVSDVFAVGASHYGIGDLESLAKETHKLESRYLDSLIGPYPERRDLYVERSPIHHLDDLSSPMILFQGTEDKAVPPNQATSMAEALRAKGLPVALVMFEGEGHGFRQAANIKRSLEAELYFYGRVLGFTPADPIDPVPIDNLP